jgi:hypothetical protein
VFPTAKKHTNKNEQTKTNKQKPNKQKQRTIVEEANGVRRTQQKTQFWHAETA